LPRNLFSSPFIRTSIIYRLPWIFAHLPPLPRIVCPLRLTREQSARPGPEGWSCDQKLDSSPPPVPLPQLGSMSCQRCEPTLASVFLPHVNSTPFWTPNPRFPLAKIIGHCLSFFFAFYFEEFRFGDHFSLRKSVSMPFCSYLRNLLLAPCFFSPHPPPTATLIGNSLCLKTSPLHPPSSELVCRCLKGFIQVQILAVFFRKYIVYVRQLYPFL